MKYIVLALSVSGHGRKVHRHGEEVNETNFEPGALPGLVKNGYLKEVPEDGDPAPETNAAPVKDPKKSFKDIEDEELRSYLTANGIDFDPAAKKKALYELYANHEPAE